MATTTTTKASHYYEGVGRRKAATARVRELPYLVKKSIIL